MPPSAPGSTPRGAYQQAPFSRMATPWNGVSLGGWLLLEPGPSTPLFEVHPDEEGEEARCEWDLMEVLIDRHGKQAADNIIRRHRQTHTTKQDFERIRACGLNAVRLPFGYWVLAGCRKDEVYAGSGLEFIDRALDWADEVGLQVVLDLHGCPGGESAEAPCGRRLRPQGTWKWQHWDFEMSLEVLDFLARRYQSRACVTGITVCNEPSNEVPLTRLCQYYSQACDVVRNAGMPASRVAVVLPVFQRPEDKFARKWQQLTGGRHQNYCFDVHCYHCFENDFNGKTFAQHLRAVEDNVEMLQTYPMVVGEWSLSLGAAAWNTCGDLPEAEVYRLFGSAQREAFKQASHGNFFWNWSEHPASEDWNFPVALERGLLSGPAPVLPPRVKKGEDPLEAQLHPAVGRAEVYYGDKICLRVFYGRYIEAHGGEIGASYPDKGTWQTFRFCAVGKRTRREIETGDVVMLKAHNGRFLTLTKKGVVVAEKVASAASRFVLHCAAEGPLRHRGVVYLESKSAGCVLDADEEEEGVFARFHDFGEWQQIAVEQMLPATRRASKAPAAALAVAAPGCTSELIVTPDAKRKEERPEPATAPKTGPPPLEVGSAAALAVASPTLPVAKRARPACLAMSTSPSAKRARTKLAFETPPPKVALTPMARLPLIW